MIMVSVNVGKDKAGKQQEPIIGLLISTQLMPMTGPSNVTMGPGNKLVQTPGQSGLQGFGVVATDKGFIVGPLSSMTPIMNPDDALKEESDDVPTELRSGEGRKEEGE